MDNNGNTISFSTAGNEENWVDTFFTGFGFPINESLTTSKKQVEGELFPGLGFSDDGLDSDYLRPTAGAFREETRHVGFDGQDSDALASFGLLRDHAANVDELHNKGNVIEPTMNISRQTLTAEEITRIAGARFIQSSTKMVDVVSLLDNPFDLSFCGLSSEDSKSVELVELLLVAAGKVGNQQYDRARRLLNLCEHSASDSGNPVQRIVYYFIRALHERIDHEIGTVVKPKGVEKEASVASSSINIYEKMRVVNTDNIAFFEKIPFGRVSHYAGIQVIIENVVDATKIHVIDLEIRTGMQWIILMQALVTRSGPPVELLKISAMSNSSSKQFIEDTGKRLSSFAETMKLPFLFKLVMVSSSMETKEELFDRDPEETLAVFSEYVLTSMITPPERLDCLMKTIRNLVPSIMVITEVEANHNSPVFINRFIEALFYTSAYFDCIATCLPDDDPARLFAESIFFGEGIRTILVKQGEERNIRNVKLDVWRKFFARFRMVETAISTSVMNQAEMMLERIPHGGFCSLTNDGGSLIIGWKGTPMHSVSTWIFV